MLFVNNYLSKCFNFYNMGENYYNVLGVSKDASQDEIKKKYRKLSLQHHPDRGGDAEQFKKISEAYENIGNPESRQRYDMEQNNPFLGGGHGGMPPGFGHDNLFNMMFGGGMPPGFGQGPNIQIFRNGVPVHNPLQRPMPIIKNIEITLEQAFNGCNLPIEVERWIVVEEKKQVEKETVYIDIPKGIDDNEIIIIKEKGNIISETNKGEIKIFIKIKNDSGFVRRGLDLYYQKEISLKESLCGFTFEMKYFNNKTFKINNSAGTVIEPHYKKVIPNMGLDRNGHKGNLIIEFTIKFPESITKEQCEQLDKIL